MALVCADALFVKPTAAGRAFADAMEEALAYPGAKPSLLSPEERWEDAEWLAALAKITAANLPLPKPTTKTKTKGGGRSPK